MKVEFNPALEKLATLDTQLVRVTRTLVFEGPANKVLEQLALPAAWLQENRWLQLPSLTMGELPRVVEVL